MAAELTFHVQRDRSKSVEIRHKAANDLERVQRATEAIRRMTRLYQERLDGKRDDER